MRATFHLLGPSLPTVTVLPGGQECVISSCDGERWTGPRAQPPMGETLDQIEAMRGMRLYDPNADD